MTHTNTPMSPAGEVEAALDRLREVTACWAGFADLLIPEADDLNVVNRQNFAALARLLSHHQPPGHEDDSVGYRLDVLCAGWTAVAGLLGEDGLSSETRDQVAMLGMLIGYEQKAALRALDAAIHDKEPSR